MKHFFSLSTYRYTLMGFLFGCCFPVIASTITSFKIANIFNWATIMEAQSNNPLLWIINMIPILFGLFGYFIGKKIAVIKKKNQKIQTINQHLKAQEQIALIGKMTAGIAHDIKNPLNFVVNFAEGSTELLEDLKIALEVFFKDKNCSNQAEVFELLEELQQNAQDIHANGQRASHIVYDLMDRTNQSKQAFQKIDLNELLEESMQLSIKSFRASHPLFKVNIEKIYHPNLGEVTVNCGSLNRVFINLLQNACDALFNKHAILENNFTPTIAIQTDLATDTDSIQVSIKDNGPGISPTLQQNIFTPFFTTKPKGQGNTGLGLSICHDIIVNEHQGELLVNSEEGKYTEFLILLPR